MKHHKIKSWQLVRGKPRYRTLDFHKTRNAKALEKYIRVDMNEWYDGRKMIVSTVLLLFYGGPDELPVFETMIFGGPFDHYQMRANSVQEARENHRKALRMTKWYDR